MEAYDYEYRVSTEVITAVEVSGGQSDPDNPVSVVFTINGRSYTVSNVYYPAGDSQLAWVRWTTPSEPCEMMIGVRVNGGGSVADTSIHDLLFNRAVVEIRVGDGHKQAAEHLIICFAEGFDVQLSFDYNF